MTGPGSQASPGSQAGPGAREVAASRDATVRGGPVSRAAAAWPAWTGTAAAASVTLALLVLVCTFVAVAVPRASLGYRTAVLQRTLHAAGAAQQAVLADGDLSGQGGAVLSTRQLESARLQFAAGLRREGLPLSAPQTQWSGLATGATTLTGAGPSAVRHLGQPQIELLYRSTLHGQSALVAGTMPASAQQHGGSTTFQVALTQATAARLGVHVGSMLAAAGQKLLVTGIVRPAGPESAFWTIDPIAAKPQLTQLGTDATPFWTTAAFVGPAEVQTLQKQMSTGPLHALWGFPLTLGAVNADQAAGLERTLEALSFLPAASSVSANLGGSGSSSSFNGTQGQSSPLAITLSDGLVSVLPAFLATDDAVQRALSLLFVSLAAIGAVVVLLGARLVTVHRDGEYAMMRARGAALRQIILVALRGGAITVLPAAAVGVVAAIAMTPGPASVLSWWLAALITVTALAGPAVLAGWRHRTRRVAAGPQGAPAARRRLTTARRWVADVMLVCAAVGGLVILRQQGLPPPGSTDFFTAAAPVLVAIPAALLVMRGYPVVLRQLTRLAGRRRGVVMIVGFARGGAAAQAGVLPAFALVLAFSVIAFAAMARSAVASADVTASWQAAGADAVVIAPAAGPGITPAAQRAIAAVPGVRRTATASMATGTSGRGLTVPVVIVDPRSYAALTAATPLPPFPAAALAPPAAAGPHPRVPALVSSMGRNVLVNGSALYVAGRTMQLRLAGRLNSFVGVTSGSGFAVVPQWALGGQAPPATVMAIVGPQLDTAALLRTAHRVVPGSTVTLRTALLTSIANAPLPHGGFVTFAQGAAAALGLSLLVLALLLVLTARSREMTLARLATMGLGPGQTRRITAVETLPAIAAAAVGGAICALALVPLVGPAVDLAAFTGMPVTVPLHANLVAIVVTAAGLVLLAWLTLAVQHRLARSRGTARALRVGE